MRIKVGISVESFLRRDESHFPFQIQINGGKRLFRFVESVANRTDNPLHYHFEKVEIALFFAYHHLPVPLVHVNGVLIVALVVAADCVHIRVNAFSASETVTLQCDTLPFCKRMYDLRLDAALLLDVEAHRAFNAVEVVVYARIALDEKRG